MPSDNALVTVRDGLRDESSDNSWIFGLKLLYLNALKVMQMYLASPKSSTAIRSADILRKS